MKTLVRLLTALVALVCLAQAVSAGQDIHLLTVAANCSSKGNIHAFDHYARTVRRTWAKHHTNRFRAKSLHGEKATRENVLKEMRRLERTSGPKTLSVIYLDMHGTAGKKGFRMSTAGSKPLLNAEDLRRELPKYKGKVLLVLDTCNAGAFLTQKQLNLPNVAVITACGPKELAYGKLPQALSEALSGKADYNHNGVVSLGEAARYIMATHTKPNVQPVMQIPSSMTPLPLAMR